MTCSGIHRNLGVHISKVKSINLDKWDNKMINFMSIMGNEKVNKWYEATLPSNLKINEFTDVKYEI